MRNISAISSSRRLIGLRGTATNTSLAELHTSYAEASPQLDSASRRQKRRCFAALADYRLKLAASYLAVHMIPSLTSISVRTYAKSG